MCTNDCINPNQFLKPGHLYNYNYTRATKVKDPDYHPTKLEERDGTFTSQPMVEPGLAFVSQARGDSLSTSYTYDITAGENVYVYILEAGVFLFDMPVSRHPISL